MLFCLLEAFKILWALYALYIVGGLMFNHNKARKITVRTISSPKSNLAFSV